MLRRLSFIVAMGVTCVSPLSIAQTYLRMELRAVESVTLSANSFTVTQPIKYPRAQTTRHCWLGEGRNGEIMNSKTGEPFDLSDPCVEKGTQVAYNAAAHQATVKSVKEFLVTTFHLPGM